MESKPIKATHSKLYGKLKKNILRTQFTKAMKVTYIADCDISIENMSDADWNGDSSDRKPLNNHSFLLQA